MLYQITMSVPHYIPLFEFASFDEFEKQIFETFERLFPGENIGNHMYYTYWFSAAKLSVVMRNMTNYIFDEKMFALMESRPGICLTCLYHGCHECQMCTCKDIIHVLTKRDNKFEIKPLFGDYQLPLKKI